jgi:GDP-L-fucose synthase
MSNKQPKIYVAGHRGMAGSAIIRELANQGQANIVVRTHAELIYDNLMVQAKVIHGAFKVGVQKLLILGLSCIYPEAVTKFMREDAFLFSILGATSPLPLAFKINSRIYFDS